MAKDSIFNWFFPKLTRKDILKLALIIILYLGLTSLNITKLPIFVDEALYLRWSQIAWHDASWRFISLTDGKQPLYIWFVIPFMKFISDPLLAGRIAAIVSGLATVLGMWYLGWLVKDKRTGYIASFLTIISPFLFFYYRFAVMESMLTAVGIWSLNLSILLAKTRRLDMGLLLGMVVGMGLLVKSSGLFFFILMPAAYALVVTRKNLISKKTLRYIVLIIIAGLIAQAFNNVQRLSPWMHMIGQKNSFFVVPFREIFQEGARLSNNIADLFRWHTRYTTLAMMLVALFGAFKLGQDKKRMAIVLAIWLLVPLLGAASIAKLFAPRYIVFATPYLLIFASYGLSKFRGLRLSIATLIVSIAPLFLIGNLIVDPVHFPYVPVDEGYVNGWSAGNGTKQIGEYLVSQAKKGQDNIIVYTEGTFGILPHGLELYTDGQTEKLHIIGLYPIGEIPPPRTVETALTQGSYLILNNTEVEGIPDGLELILQYYKRTDTSMRLYKVLAPEQS